MDRPEWRGAKPATVPQIGDADNIFALSRVQADGDAPSLGERSRPIRKLPALY